MCFNFNLSNKNKFTKKSEKFLCLSSLLIYLIESHFGILNISRSIHMYIGLFIAKISFGQHMFWDETLCTESEEGKEGETRHRLTSLKIL